MQLTYVFPILILLFIGLFFFGCPSPASAVIENAPKSAFGRRDAIALGIITSVYAVTAFIGSATPTRRSHSMIFTAARA